MGAQSLNGLFQDNDFADRILERSPLSHEVAARCGCLYCCASGVLGGVNGREEEASVYGVNSDPVGVPLEISRGAKTDLFPAAYNIQDGSIDPYEILFDPLYDMDSPLINGILLNAKWGNVDPDDYAQTDFYPTVITYYISQDDDEISADAATFEADTPNSGELVGINASMEAFSDVAQLLFEQSDTRSSYTTIAWGVTSEETGYLGVADFPGDDGSTAVSDVVLFNAEYQADGAAAQPGSYYYCLYS